MLIFWGLPKSTTSKLLILITLQNICQVALKSTVDVQGETKAGMPNSPKMWCVVRLQNGLKTLRIGGGNSNILGIFHPENWGNDPI